LTERNFSTLATVGWGLRGRINRNADLTQLEHLIAETTLLMHELKLPI